MALAIASDHAGYELKRILIEYISAQQLTVKDFGCFNLNSCHYPDYGHELAQWVNEMPNRRKGILICGTGIGMSMVANRHSKVRAALCHSTYDAMYSRKHCNANIICLGSRTTTPELAREFVEIFIGTQFEGGRHLLRVNKISTLPHDM